MGIENIMEKTMVQVGKTRTWKIHIRITGVKIKKDIKGAWIWKDGESCIYTIKVSVHKIGEY